MAHTYNYAKHNPSPAVKQASTQFRPTGWYSLSPYEQAALRREITRQVTEDVHHRIKELRTHLHEAVKNSGLDEKSPPASTGDLINYFKESVNWWASSPFEQNIILREITRQVTDELPESTKELRSH